MYTYCWSYASVPTAHTLNVTNDGTVACPIQQQKKKPRSIISMTRHDPSFLFMSTSAPA